MSSDRKTQSHKRASQIARHDSACRVGGRSLTAVGVQVGTVSELVAGTGNVGGETGVRDEAGDYTADVSGLVPEVVGVLRLDERVRSTRKSAGGSSEGACDDRSTVVVELALLVQVGQIITRVLSEQMSDLCMFTDIHLLTS